MELVKKNILSIICAVVALAAIAFHFFYTSGQFSALEAEATARAAKQAELKTLLETEHMLPKVDEGPQQKLGSFPNPKSIETAKGIVDQLKAQATALVKQAVSINQSSYALMVPDSLPAPIDTRKYDFQNQYNQLVKPGGKPQPYDPRNPAVNLPDGVLQSAVPPTELEIAEAKVKKWNEEYVPQLIMVNGQPVNQREVVANFLKATANFDQEFRRNRALNFKVYLEPGAIGINPRLDITARNAPAVEDIWFGQMSFWIQQDVCRAIARMNSKSKNIPSSPVKHLVAIDVKQDQTMYMSATPLQLTAALPGAVAGPGFTTDGEGAAPPPVEGVPAAGGPTKAYHLTPTGRVCNPLYDVVQFEVVVVVERDLVRDFVRMMQAGRFLTVLEADVQTIDLAEAVDQGYAYGTRPVVEVTMKCEALFLREWTANVKGAPMPESIKRMLGVAPPPPPAVPDANAVAVQ